MHMNYSYAVDNMQSLLYKAQFIKLSVTELRTSNRNSAKISYGKKTPNGKKGQEKELF